jgi:hypothetical protein
MFTGALLIMDLGPNDYDKNTFLINSIRYIKERKRRSTISILKTYFNNYSSAYKLFNDIPIKSIDYLGNRVDVKGLKLDSLISKLTLANIIEQNDNNSLNELAYSFKDISKEQAIAACQLLENYRIYTFNYETKLWTYSTLHQFITDQISYEELKDSSVDLNIEKSGGNLSLKNFNVSSNVFLGKFNKHPKVFKNVLQFKYSFATDKYIKISLELLYGSNSEYSLSVNYELESEYVNEDDYEFVRKTAKVCKLILKYELTKGEIDLNYLTILSDVQKILVNTFESFTRK